MADAAKARRLHAPANGFGQCEATREAKYHSDRPSTDRRCQLSSRFEVNGRRLCSKHAGVAALHLLLGEDA